MGIRNSEIWLFDDVNKIMVIKILLIKTHTYNNFIIAQIFWGCGVVPITAIICTTREATIAIWTVFINFDFNCIQITFVSTIWCWKAALKLKHYNLSLSIKQTKRIVILLLNFKIEKVQKLLEKIQDLICHIQKHRIYL